ncbi:protransforming growth factor alpha [Anarhichas minor]|uniref:protransforming growth factor alpha n=1 Tax=Anarhichas minor TaxID=65739 RepID=UPI003F7319EE
MTRIFWDTIFLISGSLFTFGAGPSNSTIIESSISINTHSTGAPNTSSSATTSSRSATTTTIAPTTKTNIPPVKTGPSNPTITEAGISIDVNSTGAQNISSSSSATTSSRGPTTTTTTTTTNIRPVKKFVAAAVRSHFDDCPDSHHHFCFHGTCRFLILEETPTCVCHPGFVGMRCEHADLLAVVATNHRQQTVATILVLCVIGCVLSMVLCTLLQ